MFIMISSPSHWTYLSKGPPPSVSVTEPQPDGVTVTFASLPAPLMVTGSATVGTSPIQSVAVELHADPTTKTDAQPVSRGDWSSWSASLTVSTEGQHTLLATDTHRRSGTAH